MRTLPPCIVRITDKPPVPPSLAVSMLLLRAYEGVSFVEAVEAEEI